MPIRYQTYVGLLPDPFLRATLDLLIEVFPTLTESEIVADIAYQQVRTPVVVWLALDQDQVVGCKLGYAQKPGHFYSWLGCVSPSFRGQGIAAELMRQQHDWCKEQGYHTVRTHTYNQWRDMLVLNIRSGFAIIGTVQGARGLMIVLEKVL